MISVLIKAVQEIHEIDLKYSSKPLDVVQSYLFLDEMLKVLLKHDLINESSYFHNQVKLDYLLLLANSPSKHSIDIHKQLAEKHCRSYSTIRDILYDGKTKK